MARGLSRQQIGVSDDMIRAYGEVVFRLSHNHQIRRGDPIRLLDYDQIEAQRPALGLTDAEIAERIGLTRDQVLFIRTIMERRRFRTGHYPRLNELGGGKRFRAERFTPHLDRFRFSEAALALRAAMNFDPERTRHYIEQGWWGSDTLRRWLDVQARAAPDRAAIVTAEATLSYGELSDRVQRLAVGLMRLGLGRGDVVAVQLPNCPEYLICFLAITYCGGVMTTLYMPHRAQEFETLLAHSQARIGICMSDAGGFAAARTMLDLRPGLPALAHVIALGEAVAGAESLTALIEGPGEGKSARDIDPPVASDPFLLLYTSGTTASPKAVPHNSHTMLSNARLSVPEHRITADDVLLSAAPFGHLFALYSFHLALSAGAANLLLPAFAPPALAALIEARRPTVLFAAPAHIAACLNMGLFDRHDISSLRLVIMSGSAVPPDLARALADRLPAGRVTQLWGMTETQAGLYTRPDDGLEISAASAGRPAPGAEARIADEAGQPVSAGEEGELQVRGCHLFPGYFGNLEAHAAAFTADGWFRSGDLGVMDADGNVAITGRIKDVINRGGVKYNPRDVEELIDRHPAVAQSAIVPVSDEVLGERACCVAVLAPGQSVTLEQLCAYLLDCGIAKTKLPERLQIVQEMPLTPTRKIIKGRLAAALK